MASEELMFVFELAVDELKSFSNSTNHQIRARFGNVFTLHLKDPNQQMVDALLPQRRGGRKKHGLKLRHGKIHKTLSVPASQSALVVSDIESLTESMLRYPIELTHYSKDEPFVLGMAEIPWTQFFIDYLKKVENDSDHPPVVLRETYKTYDEYTSKRVAVMKLKIQLSQVKNNFALTTQIRSKHGNEYETFATDNIPFETGTIRTIYSGGKYTEHSRKKDKIKDKNLKNQSYDDIDCEKTLLTSQDNDKIEINDDEHSKPLENVDTLINIEEKSKTKHSDTIIVNEDENTINIHDANTMHDCEGIADKKHADNIVSQIVQECIESANSSKHSFSRGGKHSSSIVNMVRSQTHIDNKSLFAVTKHWSSTSIEIKERLDTLNYIFGNLDGPFGNRVYCVGYFTVENDRNFGQKSIDDSGSASPSSKSTPGQPASTGRSSATSSEAGKDHNKPKNIDIPQEKKKIDDSETSKKFTFNICEKECTFGGPKNPCFEDVCNLDVPVGTSNLIDVKKCTHPYCDFTKKPAPLTDPIADEIPILVDFGTSRMPKDCCLEKVEEVTGGLSAKMTNDPCLCTCECTFGFIKKTTYCNICGGFEVAGHEIKSSRGVAPFPCPVYHGIGVKGKKGLGKKSSGGPDDSDATPKPDKKKKKSFLGDSLDSDKEAAKKIKKRKKDPRFKFNYGYKGIPPQIGHSQCILPCTGDLKPVPKRMGWLWTANNIPGLKVRPSWRPGAANKYVVRMLRNARFPEEQSKRRRKETTKKKRPLKRPLLVVQKKDGEYNITMETMKTFNKPRLVNQAPYEDKPVIQYTVGRTDEENEVRRRRKERAQRRLEREQRAFLQSAFHDMCKEICLKTYQQALGMLPFAEDSFCPCYPEDPPPDRIDESHSCSCSDDRTRSSESGTDDDEWVIEFTPPVAYYNPASPVKKIVTVNDGTQYTYLDYRVKLFDHFGNPVPRFFTGPDGKQQCSDLGGFWSPEKKWLEINVDGYIGPDAKWAPNTFYGPCGECVDGETGKFQTSNGVWLTVGVDGYVDGNLKWHFYPKPKTDGKDPRKQGNIEAWKKAGGCIPDETKDKKNYAFVNGVRRKKSETTWSCFGDASPHTLSHMGIAGHGHDRRLLLSTLEQLLKQGEDVTIPRTTEVPRAPGKHRNKKPRHMAGEYPERMKCKHVKPSDKGIEAVNDRGHKTYFQFKEPKSPRQKQRIEALNQGGISLSSFHVPCFSSFINSEMARKQQIEHILQHNARLLDRGMQTY